MKQFKICISLSLLFHLLCSILASSFNPFLWSQEGKYWYLFFQMVIWVVPMFLNYLDGKEQFKD